MIWVEQGWMLQDKGFERSQVSLSKGILSSAGTFMLRGPIALGGSRPNLPRDLHVEESDLVEGNRGGSRPSHSRRDQHEDDKKFRNLSNNSRLNFKKIKWDR